MPSWDETCDSMSDPSSSASRKKRIYLKIPRKIKVVHEFYSQKDGHNTMSEAFRSGIKQCEEGSLVLRTDMDEQTKINAVLGKIENKKNLKYDTYNTEIRLEENLLQKFDRLILQKDLKSRNRAIREIVYAQIMEWKKKYDSTQKKEDSVETIKNGYAIEGEKKLNEHLEMLKHFSLINIPGLTVVWQPKNNYHLHGEVIGKTICIYDMTYEEAITTLEHEYLHKFCKIVSKPAEEGANTIIIVMNMLVRHLNREIYEQQEKIIDKFVERMRKKQVTS